MKKFIVSDLHGNGNIYNSIMYYLENLKDSIKSAVVYNSSFNSYSNGLSVYFPYYGSDDYISTHLYAFDKLWNNDYLNFINKYVELTSSAKRAKRAGVEDKVLLYPTIL